MTDRALRNKLLIAYAATFAVFCLLVFPAAGTARYWQAWLYLAVFLGLGLVLSFLLLRDDPALLASRLSLTPLAEPGLDQKIIQCASSVLFLALPLVCAVDFRLHGARVPGLAALLANLLIAVGARLLHRIFKANRYAASIVTVQRGQTVIDAGPYAVVRHPMYSWAVGFFLVTPPALASVWGFVPALLLCVVIVIRLLREERYLRSTLPGYREYCAKVRYRLIPSVW